jgi:hypothetical protein
MVTRLPPVATHGAGLSPAPQRGRHRKSSTAAGSEQQDIPQIQPGGQSRELAHGVSAGLEHMMHE